MGDNLFLKRLFIFASIFFLVIIVASSPAQSACDRVLGEWFSPDKDGKFLFYKSGGCYFGKIIWLKETRDECGKLKTDKHNHDPARRNDPMMGIVIFKNFKWDAEDEKWVDGKVYDARNGDTWSCEMKMVSNLVLEVHGYLIFTWLGKSAYFSRY